jgi:hypothetical protein
MSTDAGAPFAGNVKGFFEDEGQFVDIGDQVVVLADRAG